MTCHSQIKKNSPKLEVIHEAWNSGRADGPAVRWTRIHEAPDYAYFNHAIHVNSGVSCVSCHGNVNHMEVVWHQESLSMGWCLECHRHPEAALRPLDKVYDLDWKNRGSDSSAADGSNLVKQLNINPSQSCAACHR